ncbi:hypothetical protein [Kibdelosporangium phytohabitans]|uniref:hypothetical protein n=1 Tax=Kibdelosporangium phytohabitans TaxID=860235 RepID=UPI0012F91ADA|nr:hypothetical protein [Kibdelosporangium phytohabitans]MBE1464016.1 hypothetical protein [Kibdelosporangium phytohabitans]
MAHDEEQAGALIDDVHVKPMVMRGCELDGWLRVAVDALGTDDQPRSWVERGTGFGESLPAR